MADPSRSFTDSVLIHLPPQVQARARFLRQIGVEEKSPIEAVQQARRDGMAIEDIASAIGLDRRTIYRYLSESSPCPGPRCLTMVRGGGLCRFCRRTAELAA